MATPAYTFSEFVAAGCHPGRSIEAININADFTFKKLKKEYAGSP